MAPSVPNFPNNHIYPTAPAPNDDISAIAGNCTPEHKQWNANILAYFVGSDGESVFGQSAFKGMKLVEMNMNKRKIGSTANADDAELEGQTVCELEVKEGTVHGFLEESNHT